MTAAGRPPHARMPPARRPAPAAAGTAAGVTGGGRNVTGGGPVTLVLSRSVRPGHEQAFEAVLRELAAAVREFPGQQGLTVLRPRPGGPATYTIVTHFASGADLDAWMASEARARLVAEADAHAAGALATRYLSGLEGWLAPPGPAAVAVPARWKIVLISLAGIAPLLEAVAYLLAPRLAAVPAWGRPLIAAALVIPLMQYAVMPLLTRAARGFLYPQAGSPG